MKKYVVQPGDTLFQISKRTGVRIPLLLAANPQLQNPQQLMAGSTIVIPELGKPATGPQTQKKPTTTPKTSKKSTKQMPMPPYFGFVWPHQVQKGETWNSLAKKYHVSLEQLNHVNPEHSLSQPPKPGSMIYVPTPALPTQMPHQGQPAGMQMPGAPGMYPAEWPQMGPGMPYGAPGGQMSAPSAAPTQPTTVPAAGEEPYGPHSHNPYRAGNHGTKDEDPMSVPRGWYVDGQESSSLFQTGDGFDGAAPMRSVPESKGKQEKAQSSEFPATDNDGWSETFTIRLDPKDN